MRTIMITGGGSGIGLAVAQTLVKSSDYKVLIAGRRRSALDSAIQQTPQLIPLQLDITDEPTIAATFEQLRGQNLLPEILINCAGAAHTAPFHRTSLDAWNAMLSVNLTGSFLMTKAALPGMQQAGFGRIVNIASTAGLKGYNYTTAYTAAKHGVIGMTRALALELASQNITVNAVCPGFTDTDIVEEALENITTKTGRSRAEALAELTKHNPQKRLIDPKEIAHTVRWLISDAAHSITGQSIAVAGGEVM